MSVEVDVEQLAEALRDYGFAYLLTDKTTIRGGWGNFYAPSPQQAHGTVGPFGFRTQTPWVGSIDGITPNDLLTNPYPRGFTPPPGSSQGLPIMSVMPGRTVPVRPSRQHPPTS